MAELLFWPALLAYGEAAAAYYGEARHPGRLGRAATWGVRIGWLLQTALLIVQAVSADGFPWGSWAGSLNLFVWLVVGIYLVWGCNSRFRLLGLAVLPLAAVLFALAYAAGGTSTGGTTSLPNLFLVLHVGLVLAAFAGFTLAAALSALYLWQERRLKRREPGILRVTIPSLASLDELAARIILVALPALSSGSRSGSCACAPRAAAWTRSWPQRCSPGRCTRPSSSSGTASNGGAVAPRTSRSRASRSSSASSSASRRCTSDEARPRRHLSPPHTDRAA